MSALRVVWTGDSETDCVEICRDLQSAGIEYRVSQTAVGRSGRMGVIWRFKIGVFGADYESAKEVLGLNVVEGGPVEGSLELYDPTAMTEDAKPSGTVARADEYLKPWRPEDETVGVWTESSSSSIIELALTENMIHYRIGYVKDGARKYFVLPQDEFRAREIVRQIERGEPPS